MQCEHGFSEPPQPTRKGYIFWSTILVSGVNIFKKQNEQLIKKGGGGGVIWYKTFLFLKFTRNVWLPVARVMYLKIKTWCICYLIIDINWYIIMCDVRRWEGGIAVATQGLWFNLPTSCRIQYFPSLGCRHDQH